MKRRRISDDTVDLVVLLLAIAVWTLVLAGVIK